MYDEYTYSEQSECLYFRSRDGASNYTYAVFMLGQQKLKCGS